ncbi:flagellar filament capping protein FliD [Burkholderia sp. PAMC 26561]|uniref:flagellar filament capping protein FliD n=1 Tax=Burkholderia sp. PAMC 26561 TaxID=1795043 RepID=UPI00076B5B1C|nr:flagellar filament capping protein FliD [Burkholderia sp. PAMC 26561]AME22812.1 flagellar hook protein FliD [Burkholderia sp. PAMC 26561]
MSTITTSSTGSTVDPNSALQQAAQSIISGSTGSTADVNALVSAIVGAKVAPQTDAITNKTNTDNTQLTALGQLKSVMSLLQSSLTSLSDGTTMSAFTATGDGKGITAKGTAGAVAGSYTVQVSNIATSQSITSGAFKTTDTLGTGTMTLSVGGKSMSVNVTSSNNTLAGIAAAINSGIGNPGVTAAIVNGTDGAHLVLRSATTGVANGINVSIAGAGSTDTLNNLAVTSGTVPAPASSKETAGNYTGAATSVTAGAWTQSVAGQDANFSIEGTPGTSASNTITTALSGLSMTLDSTSVGTTQTLTVAPDTTGQASAINAFVTAYNNLVTTATSLTTFDATQAKGSQGGALLGDSMLNTIRNTLASAISGGVGTGSSAVNLGSIGITLQPDGTLKTDSDALTAALTNDPTTVSKLFNSTNGLGTTMNGSLTSFLATGGIMDTRTTALNSDLASLKDQQTQLTAYTAQLTTSYNDQFTALNTLMSQSTSNANYLTALFGGTNSAGALATNK